MKKAGATDRDTLLPEYRREDLGKGVRGKYYAEYTRGTNLVLLSPDVAEVFPTSDAVNEALRSLAKIARSAAKELARSRARTRPTPPPA